MTHDSYTDVCHSDDTCVIIEGLTKFYMFAQELGTENYHLLEVVVDIATRCLTATFKSDAAEHAGDFGISFRGALAGAFEAM